MTLLKSLLRGLFQLIRDTDGVLTWATTWWIPKKPIQGACKKRGICCRNIAVGTPKLATKSTLFLRLINWWYTFVYNFKLKGWYDKQQILLYTCNYLKHNKCSIYWRRPLICREYPHSKRIGKTTMPGCGFHIEESSVPSPPTAGGSSSSGF